VLESGLLSALAGGGLPPPERQFPLPGRGALYGLVDAAYPDVRLILEADGRRWHTRIRDLRRDHLRDAETARAGWQTLRFLYEEITVYPHELAATVADVRCIRAAQLGRSAG
jgi:very-short-patch-repair endonuclease